MIRESLRIGNRTIELESGRIARQAHGAILLREGKTVILSTVVYDSSSERDVDFLPLTVDYRELMSAAGRIPGGFFRREGRGTEREVLASRFCDRSIRPLFPKGYRRETQVISTVLSYDPESDPTVLSMISAAAALHVSEVPWDGPMAAIRIARTDEVLLALPSPAEIGKADLDLVVSLSREGVVMIEGGASQVPDPEILAALEFARQEADPLLDLMDKLSAQSGQRPASRQAAIPEPAPPPETDPNLAEVLAQLEKQGRDALTRVLREGASLPDKQARAAAVRTAVKEITEHLPEEHLPSVLQRLRELEAEILRERVLKENMRLDGRGLDEIRPISSEVDWLPSTHGSALFTRGETQAMVSLTLGTQQDRMLVETLEGVSYQHFMLHYNFPPYSVGEVRPLRGPGRREIGHGTLARRALAAVLPDPERFPYTIRLLSEISESNGSSSMATVCGGSLALMDGGVPIAAPVAGIAMGMIQEGEQYAILSDILGDEDHLGDMDFKVAGTEKGITAIQMDNKIGSLPPEVMSKAFEQARRGRLHILAKMAEALGAPRQEVKSHTPVIVSLSISPNRVRDLIGPGGRIIQEIQRTHGVRLEVDDGGTVRIFAPNRDGLNSARDAVLEVAGSMEVGAVYEGVVTGVKDFGAFVRIRGQDGLVHISEWAAARVEKMSDVTREGELVRVKVLEPDKAGRLSLSRKAAL